MNATVTQKVAEVEQVLPWRTGYRCSRCWLHRQSHRCPMEVLEASAWTQVLRLRHRHSMRLLVPAPTTRLRGHQEVAEEVVVVEVVALPRLHERRLHLLRHQ
jgi:hypothetical protein